MRTFTEILASKTTTKDLKAFFANNDCQFLKRLDPKKHPEFPHAGFFLNPFGRLCFWTIVDAEYSMSGTPYVCFRRAISTNDLVGFKNVFAKTWLDYTTFIMSPERKLIPEYLYGSKIPDFRDN